MKFSLASSGLRAMLLLNVLFLPACQEQVANVSGTVTSRGKAVPFGVVLLHGANGQMVYGTINKDGTYAIPNVPTGEVRAAIGGSDDAMPTTTPPTPGAPPPPRTGARPAVPTKYLKPETSDLKYTVQPGNQTINIQAD
jgi:hypothetical protein